MSEHISVRTRAADLFWHYLGHWFERKGLAGAAESCFGNISKNDGRYAADAAFRLSQLYLASERNREAIDTCEIALEKFPRHARLWCALGAGRRRLALIDGAGDAYRQAVQFDPNYAQAWTNLGEWYLVKGEPAEALAKFERALQIEPTLVEALNNRVAALYELARFVEAEAAASKAIEIHPRVAALHVNLANVLLHTGKARQASIVFRTALECDPLSPEANLGLATLLGETSRLVEALGHLEQEIALKGESAQRLVMLASAQFAKKDWQAAERSCKKVLELQPENVSALTTLAACYTVRADHDGAIELQKRALAQNPQMPGIYSNIAFDVTYVPQLTAQEVFAYHQGWADRFEKIEGLEQYEHVRPEVLDRPLRIGYVSGDFGSHPVGFLLRDVLRHHDKEKFSIYCYSMVRQNDDPITVEIRNFSDSWVDVLFMDDDELAKRIYADQIDILVDLSGHTAYNRLPVFVRKAAPVQATWIGYFHSTGLSSIDYFITDPFTTPQQGNQLFSERPAFLPHSRFCYSPPPYAPLVAPTPCLEKGHITFGSFNRAEKLVDAVLEIWAKIVNAVPNSKLLLKAGAFENESVCDDFRRRFEAFGLERSRLELRMPSAHSDMLGEYGEIDIALDPFPFNGGLTTMEALWMGVPVVALEGQSVVSRQSTSLLMNLELPELVFPDLEAYVSGAISLAENPERLQKLRFQMRNRMLNSPICRPEQFSSDLELLYTRMWQAWQNGKKLDSDIVSAPTSIGKKLLHVGGNGADRRSLPLKFQSRWDVTRVDADSASEPDIVAGMLDLSVIADASADAVFCSHKIVQLHAHEVGTTLREFRRVLKTDGLLLLVCPDLQAISKMIVEDKLEDAAYMSAVGPITPIDMLFGYHVPIEHGNLQGMHKTGFTAKRLENALKDAGFSTVVIEPGQIFDLWALAYPTDITADRLGTDRNQCFPRSRIAN